MQKLLRGCVRALQGALADRGPGPGANPELPHPAAPGHPPKTARVRDGPSSQGPGCLGVSQQGGRSVRRKLDFDSCSTALIPALQGQQPPLGLAFSAATGSGAAGRSGPVQPPRPPPTPGRARHHLPVVYNPFSAGQPTPQPPNSAPAMQLPHQLQRPPQAPLPPQPPPPMRPSALPPQRPPSLAPCVPQPPTRTALQPGPPRPPISRAAPSPPLQVPALCPRPAAYSADPRPRLTPPSAGRGFPQPPTAPGAALTTSGPQPLGSTGYRPPPPPPLLPQRQHPQQLQQHQRFAQPPPCPRPPPGPRPDGHVGPLIPPRGLAGEAANNACGQGGFRGPPMARCVSRANCTI